MQALRSAPLLLTRTPHAARARVALCFTPRCGVTRCLQASKQAGVRRVAAPRLCTRRPASAREGGGTPDGDDDAPWVQDLSAELVIRDAELEARAALLTLLSVCATRMTMCCAASGVQERASRREARHGGVLKRLSRTLLMVRARVPSDCPARREFVGARALRCRMGLPSCCCSRSRRPCSTLSLRRRSRRCSPCWPSSWRTWRCATLRCCVPPAPCTPRHDARGRADPLISCARSCGVSAASSSRMRCVRHSASPRHDARLTLRLALAPGAASR